MENLIILKKKKVNKHKGGEIKKNREKEGERDLKVS